MLRESVYREEHQPGSTIFREGEPGDCAYVIERGVVRLETLRRGRKITIADLGEGELFGEMALIDGEVSPSTASATEETVLVVISLDQLRDLQCDYDQGYLFSEPVGRDQILARIEFENSSETASNITPIGGTLSPPRA
jgi:CRP-like cAMP-binding protein